MSASGCPLRDLSHHWAINRVYSGQAFGILTAPLRPTVAAVISARLRPSTTSLEGLGCGLHRVTEPAMQPAYTCIRVGVADDSL